MGLPPPAKCVGYIRVLAISDDKVIYLFVKCID